MAGLYWKPIEGLQVAMDGPSGSGKGTVAKRVGEELGLPVLDTGLLYRFSGWQAVEAARTSDPGRGCPATILSPPDRNPDRRSQGF